MTRGAKESSGFGAGGGLFAGQRAFPEYRKRCDIRATRYCAGEDALNHVGRRECIGSGANRPQNRREGSIADWWGYKQLSGRR